MPAAILPPLIIITGAFAVIGGGIYACQKGFDGRIKHVGADEFDRMMVPPSTTDATTFYVCDLQVRRDKQHLLGDWKQQ